MSAGSKAFARALRNAKIMDAISKDLPLAAIADVFGVSVSTVSRVRRKFVGPDAPRKKRWSANSENFYLMMGGQDTSKAA